MKLPKLPPVKVGPVTPQGLLYTGIGLAVVYVGWKVYKALNGGALDITSDNNVAASSVNSIGGAITGQGSNWTLGGAIYDLFHTDQGAAYTGSTHNQPGG